MTVNIKQAEYNFVFQQFIKNCKISASDINEDDRVLNPFFHFNHEKQGIKINIVLLENAAYIILIALHLAVYYVLPSLHCFLF